MKPFYFASILLLSIQISFAQFLPIDLGRSSNIESITQPNQNQVYVDNQTNTVIFIHRQDVTIWGGGGAENGKFRYDISTDGGQTFTTDIGALQETYSKHGRHPQITGYNPDNSSDPLDTKFIYWGATLDPSSNLDGQVTGIGDVVSMGNPNNTENYLYSNDPTHIAGGLCQGIEGEFWLAEADNNDTNFSGFISLNKGTYNSNTEDMDWTIPVALNPNHDGASPHILAPNMAFSPDGSVGWVAFGGDVAGSTNGVYTPILYRTLDSGDSWTGPFFINFNAISWIDDRLSSFVAGSGNYGMVHSFDLTVDANGNPHVLTVVGHASNFEVPNGNYNKLLVDLTSDDLGATLKANYVAPVLNTWGSFGTPDNNGDLFEMDNFCQISRSEDGQIIFYDWIDSEVEDGNGSYEYSGLLAPNLRASAYHVTNDTRTCIRKVTDLDLIWEGRALCPTVAPTVVEDNGQYKVPIVMVEMITNDQLQPCRFYYFGNEVVFGDEDFVEDYNPDNYIGSDANACEFVLPIDLLSFTATAEEQAINLDWEISGHINTSVFEVERRSEIDKNFQVIGEVATHQQGRLQTYLYYKDETAKMGLNYYYRLKWKEDDGQIRYSAMQSARIKTINTVVIYPNPAQDDLFIKRTLPLAKPMTISIFDVNGRLMQTHFLKKMEERAVLNLNLPAGVYGIKMATETISEFHKLVVY